MRLHDQRDTLQDGMLDMRDQVVRLRDALHRKMRAPFGDGSRSNMVNAETDVLPLLEQMLETVELVRDMGALR